MTVRWVLFDPATSESWTMPINPNAMTSPEPTKKNLKHVSGVLYNKETLRTFMNRPTLHEWEWKGVIRTKEHYDAYVYWMGKTGAVQVTDHLGRTWEVFLKVFDPEDRRPMATVPWRLNYTVKSVVTRRIS